MLGGNAETPARRGRSCRYGGFGRHVMPVWSLAKHAGITAREQAASLSRICIGWAAPRRELRTRLEIAAHHRKLGLPDIFLGPFGERVTMPGRFQVEPRQR